MPWRPAQPRRVVVLAGIEASLALMRDMLIADKAAIMRDLATVAAAPAEGWLTQGPLIGQMVMGFMLPFALAFVAIPLEVLVYSLRTTLGVLIVMVVCGLAFVLRLLALVCYRLERVLVNVFDITIVVPLLIERWVLALRGGGAAATVATQSGRAT